MTEDADGRSAEFPPRDSGASTPRQVVAKYFERVRAKDADGVSALFTEDCLVTILGNSLTGRAALRESYAAVFATSDPAPSPSAMIVEGNDVCAQFEAASDGGRVGMVDVFHLDQDGLISSLRVYRGV